MLARLVDALVDVVADLGVKVVGVAHQGVDLDGHALAQLRRHVVVAAVVHARRGRLDHGVFEAGEVLSQRLDGEELVFAVGRVAPCASVSCSWFW